MALSFFDGSPKATMGLSKVGRILQKQQLTFDPMQFWLS